MGVRAWRVAKARVRVRRCGRGIGLGLGGFCSSGYPRGLAFTDSGCNLQLRGIRKDPLLFLALNYISQSPSRPETCAHPREKLALSCENLRARESEPGRKRG